MTRIVVNRKYLLYMSIIYQDRQVVQFPSKNGPKIPYPQLNLKKLSAPPPPYQAEIPPPFGFFKNFLSPSLLKKKGGKVGGTCLLYLCWQTDCKFYHTRNKLLDYWLQSITKTWRSSIFKIPKTKSGIPDMSNRERSTYECMIFFSFLRLCSKSELSKLDITATVLL